eukprot:5926336-Pyramimonas_sp.AAC.1
MDALDAVIKVKSNQVIFKKISEQPAKITRSRKNHLMINITDFPKEPTQLEAPTISTKALDVWTVEKEGELQSMTAAIEKITTAVNDTGIMTKSRKKQVDVWIADNALEQ